MAIESGPEPCCMPQSMLPEEASAPPYRTRRAVRDGRMRRVRAAPALLEGSAADAARAGRAQPPVRRAHLPRLRGRSAQLRASVPRDRRARQRAARSLRHPQGRSRRDRDAQLSGVGDRVLGCGLDRRDRRAAQRVVDGRRAGVRPGRLRHARADRRSRARRAHRAAPRGARARSRARRARRHGTRRRTRCRSSRCSIATAPDASLPDGRDRPGRRRHDLLHLGHDRPAQGRARHAPQHGHERRQRGVRARARQPAQGHRPARARRSRAADRRRCSRCRCSTSPAATRCSRTAPRSARSS